MNEIQNSLFEAMKKISEYSVSNTNSTITIECKICELVDEGKGLYKVEYLGNTFTVHTNNINIKYSPGDKVYVLVPDGDFTKDKILFGSSSPSSNQYAIDTDSLSYHLVSDSLIDLNFDIIKMSSYEDTYFNEVDIVNDNEKKRILAEILSKYFNDYKTLSLGFSVKTSLDIEQQTSGNYGVTIGIPLIANSIEGGGNVNSITKYYTLDVGNMNGNPYSMNVWSTQNVYFDIDEQFSYDINRVPTISYFCYGFSHDVNKIDIKDIWLKDITLNVVDRIEERDKTGYTLSLKATEGEYFANGYKKNKTIIPELRINNNVTNISDCSIYWFREDASIKNDNKFYSPYGGFGWKCLNRKTNIAKADDGTETFTYLTNEKEWVVKDSEVEAATRYKCVVIYKNNIASAIITLKNLLSTKSIDLISTNGSNVYIKDTGYVDLTAITYADGYTSYDKYKNSIIYSWMRYDKNDNFIEDSDDFINVVNYNNIVNNHYETRIKFPVNAIEDYNIIYCSAYLVLEEDGEINKTLIGTKSIAISTSNEINYLLTVNNGNKIFKYDSDGDSPMGEAYDGPVESKITSLEALSYNLYKQDGQELTEDEYRYCKYKWFIPINSMIVVNKEYLDVDEDENVLITDDNFYTSTGYGNKNSLPYSIAKRFNTSKSENNIILKVEFNGSKLENSSIMNFIKEGDSGTNGTTYAAVLVMGSSAQSGVAYGARNSLGVAQKEKFVYNINNKTWYFHDTANNVLKNWNDRKRIYARVYQNSEILTYNVDYTINYSMFDADTTKPCFNIQNVDSAGGILLGVSSENKIGNIDDTYVNIIQAEINISKGNTSSSNAPQKIYAYYPIEITICDISPQIIENHQMFVPSMDGGFAHVLYATDGTNPAWDETEDFKCDYGKDIYDCLNIEWNAAEHHFIMPRLPYGETKYLGSSIHIEPVNKYDDGDSKNYIKAEVTFNSLKETDLNNELNNLYVDITDLNNKISEENKNLNYLTNFANAYTLNKWNSNLDDIKILFDRQTNVAYRLNTLIESSIVSLDNYLNLQQNYNNIDFKSYCIELFNELSILKNKCQKALEQINKLSDKTGYHFTDLIDLINYKLSWNESIKQKIIESVSLDASLTVELLIQDINSQIDNYEASLGELKELSGRGYEKTYEDIRVDIISACESIPDTAFSKYVDMKNKILTYTKLFDTVTSITDIKDFINKMYYDVLSTVFKLKDGILSINTIVMSDIQNHINEYKDKINKSVSRQTDIINVLLLKNGTIVHIKPIVFTFNRYEMSNINAWDGNKIETGDGSYLLSPQVGAGIKENDNSFTGIVMGIRNFNVGADAASTSQVGMFGYSKGLQSLRLDAKTGTSIFGIASSEGSGQIIIDPDNGGLLYSSNYWKNYDKNTGMPSKYSDDNKSGNGMLLDLKKGHIHLGSAADGIIYSGTHNSLDSTTDGFFLNQNGLSIGSGFKISTDGASTINHKDSDIGHWKVDENGFVSNKKNGIILDSNNSTIHLLSSNGKIYSADHKIFGDNDNPGFYLSHDGLSIVSKYEADGAIRTSKIAMSTSGNPVLYSNGHNYISSDRTGFYLGQDGLEICNGANSKIAMSTSGNPVLYSNGHSMIGSNAQGFYLGQSGLEICNGNTSKITMSTNGNPVLYSNGHSSLASTNEGFYLGNEGLSIGSQAKLTKTGVLYLGYGATKETGNSYWTIGGNETGGTHSYISYGGATSYSGACNGGRTSQVYVGTDGIALGEYFRVSNQGALTASSGNIGGWSIESNKLSANDIEINSSGSIKQSNNKWSINSDGSANFNNITCNSVWSFGSGNNTWSNYGFTFGSGTLGGNSVYTNEFAFSTGTIGLGTAAKGNNGISWNGTKCIIAGDIYANNGYFSGEVQASSGKIGGITISSSGISGSGWSLYSTGGSIGGWSIHQGKLESGSAYLSPSGATLGGCTLINQTVSASDFYIGDTSVSSELSSLKTEISNIKSSLTNYVKNTTYSTHVHYHSWGEKAGSGYTGTPSGLIK